MTDVGVRLLYDAGGWDQAPEASWGPACKNLQEHRK